MTSEATMARRPIVGVTAALIVGILLGSACGHATAAAVGWCLAASFWLCCGRRQACSRRAAATVWLLVGLSGWLAAAVFHERRQDEILWLYGHKNGPATVDGIVTGDVAVRPLSQGGACHTFGLRQAAIAVPAHPAVWPVRQTPVQVSWYGPMDPTRAPRMGETWRFDCKRWSLFSRRGRYQLSLESRLEHAVRLAPPRAFDWRTSAARLRTLAARRLALGIEAWEGMSELIQAMLLGCRSEIPPAMNRVFRDSGTVHIFAISGMHVALVAGVMIFLLAAAGVPRTLWGVVLGPMLLAYALFTGARASAMRACLMGTLYFCAPLVGRKPDGLSTLAAAALILLAIDPSQLADLGFLLSFVVVAGLFLLCKPLSQGMRRLFGVAAAGLDIRAAALDGLPADGVVPAGRWRAGQRLRIGLADLIAVSLAAWISSAPLTACFFGRFVPGSFPANLLVVPTFFLVVVAGLLSLIFGLFSDFLAVTFNHAAAALTAAMVWAAHATVRWPGASFRITPPPTWIVLAWYAVVGLIAWRLARRQTLPQEDPW